MVDIENEKIIVERTEIVGQKQSVGYVFTNCNPVIRGSVNSTLNYDDGEQLHLQNNTLRLSRNCGPKLYKFLMQFFHSCCIKSSVKIRDRQEMNL